MVDSLDLVNLHEPHINILRGCYKNSVTMVLSLTENLHTKHHSKINNTTSVHAPQSAKAPNWNLDFHPRLPSLNRKYCSKSFLSTGKTNRWQSSLLNFKRWLSPMVTKGLSTCNFFLHGPINQNIERCSFVFWQDKTTKKRKLLTLTKSIAGNPWLGKYRSESRLYTVTVLNRTSWPTKISTNRSQVFNAGHNSESHLPSLSRRFRTRVQRCAKSIEANGGDSTGQQSLI